MAAAEIVAVDPAAPDPDVIARAAAIIQRGGLVGIPTETVYGLAGNALDPAAIARIYAAKGRPSQNPLIVHVASEQKARELAAEWPAMAHELASRFWPGPMTLVVRRKAVVPDAVTAGLHTFGVRVPDHPVALALIKASFTPLAAPSANRFTEVSPVTAQQVWRGLGDAVELILDAGRTRVGIESTVIDVSGGRPVILRPGMLERATIEAVVGPAGRASIPIMNQAAHPAPGMSARHYAPRARVRLLETAALRHAVQTAGASGTAGAAGAAGASGGRPGAVAAVPAARLGALLCQTPYPHDWSLPFVVALGADAAHYAAGLYDALHAADAADCEELLVELPPDTPAWDAIRDRLRRAAHP